MRKSEFSRHELPFWGLVAFCIVSPLSIAATNIAWVCTLLAWIYQARVRKSAGSPVLQRTALDPGFGLFFIASLLSLWASMDPGASLLEFRSLGLIAVYYLFAWNARRLDEKKCLVVCLLVSATLAACYGIGEFFTGRDLLGHYDPAFNKIGGFFSMHLTLGAYLAMTVCVIMGILLWATSGKKAFAAGLAAVFLMLLAIFLSGAKAAFLGFLVGGAVVFGLKGKRHLSLVLGTVFLLVLLLGLWKSGTHLKSVIHHYSVDAEQRTGPLDSNTQRLYMWWTGLRVSCSYFMNGVGLHAVETVYPAFRHGLARDPNQWHLHNNFLQLGVTRGFFGLTAFLYLLILAFRSGYRNFRACVDPWEKGLTAGVLGALPAFLICGLTEYSWGDSEVLMALYMLMGLAVSSPRPLSPTPESGKGFRRRVTPPQDSDKDVPEPESLGIPLSGKILFSLFSVVLILACFLLDPAYGSTGMRILEPVVGLSLLALLVLRPYVRFPVPLWRSQTIACIVVFAGYCFTRHLWANAEDCLSACTMPPAAGTALLLVNLLFFALLMKRIRSGAVFSLFDLAVFGAAVLWMGIALGTNLLLHVATGQGMILGTPFQVLFPLCTMVILLYGTTRLFYSAGRVQNLLLAGMGLCLILHALL